MAEPNEDQKKDSVELQKQYLVEKFGGLMTQIGEGYGRPLLEELIRRLEKTVAEFHEEVSDLIGDLKERSRKRHEKLITMWEREEEEVEVESVEEEAETVPAELSEWERRLEEKAVHERELIKSKAEKSKAVSNEESKPPKKRRFGRKKA